MDLDWYWTAICGVWCIDFLEYSWLYVVVPSNLVLFIFLHFIWNIGRVIGRLDQIWIIVILRWHIIHLFHTVRLYIIRLIVTIVRCLSLEFKTFLRTSVLTCCNGISTAVAYFADTFLMMIVMVSFWMTMGIYFRIFHEKQCNKNNKMSYKILLFRFSINIL